MAPYVIEHTIVLTVGGNNVTSYLQAKTLEIVDVLTQQIDTCTFTLRDKDGLMPAISSWDEVTVVEGAVKHFAGYVTRVKRGTVEASIRETECFCQDYSALLGTEAVNSSFTNQTDATIIAAIFARMVTDEGFDATTHVASSGTIDHIRFNRISLLDAMRQLAEASGYDWYVDYDKAVWYFNPATGAALAPFDLSDSSDQITTFPYDIGSVSEEADGEDIRNRIYVYGGMYEAPAFAQSWIADGSQQEFWLAYQPVTVTGVTVDGVAQSFGVDFVDNPNSYDCLVNYQEKVIRFYQAAPAATAVVVCTYSFRVPIAVRVQDAASRAAYGRWFDFTIVDVKISSIQEAKDIGNAMLTGYAYEKTKARVATRKPGLRSGQIVEVTNALLGLVAEPYLIQRIRKGFFGLKHFLLDLELGKLQYDLIDLLLKLKREQRDYLGERSAETLRLIISLGPEAVDISELATISLDLTGEYVWGDAPGLQEGYWDAATWG